MQTLDKTTFATRPGVAESPDEFSRVRRPLWFRRLRTGAVALGVAIAGMAVALRVLKTVVAVYTSDLWFDSLHLGDVYQRQLVARTWLFAIFGGITLVAVAVSLAAAIRFAPVAALDPSRQRRRAWFVTRTYRWRGWVAVAVTLYYGLAMGSRAAGSWQTWLLWRNAVPFDRQDPQFHRDISYFVFIYPFHRLVLSLLIRICLTSLALTTVTAYAYGALRIRGSGPKTTRAFRVQFSVLLGVCLVLKGGAYWLDRFARTTSNRGVVTGLSYTDVHAVLPGKLILAAVALLGAVAMFANAVIDRRRLPLAVMATMAVAALVFDVVTPAAVQRLKDKPSASVLEQPAVASNITATRAAFGLTGAVSTTSYHPTRADGSLSPRSTVKSAQVRLLDPNQLSPTFTQLQQIRSFYAFKSTLDVEHYPLAGREQDVLLAVRELRQAGLPASQRTWTNTHLVYTHGYGVVAAPTMRTDKQGEPAFTTKSLPGTGALGEFRPQIYYGQMSPSYSIVGSPTAGQPREFDHPAADGSGQVDSTYSGSGGISLRSRLHRLAYALKYRSASFLLSSEIGENSQLLTVRNPAARVAKVAPWLTLDGDAYPVVANHHILWVVDGYTTSNSYPDSQQVNLRAATSTTLTQNGSSAAQPNTSVNYMRNSVKATVDAYTGKVTLYQWNPSGGQNDPVLATWEKAFPGLVHPQTAIPASLLAHLRYPTDLFNVQRKLLAIYHVTNAADFYAGDDFWKVPSDPTAGTATGKHHGSGGASTPSLPSTYMTLSPSGTAPAVFSLTSPLVTPNKRDLAALLTVDSQPGPQYGRFTLLEIPASRSVQGPAQVQNEIESDPNVAQQLTLLRGGKSKVVVGNLLSVPVAGQMLYVEPIYTQAVSGSSFPILRRVIAIYGKQTPSYATTLSAALNKALPSTEKPPKRRTPRPPG